MRNAEVSSASLLTFKHFFRGCFHARGKLFPSLLSEVLTTARRHMMPYWTAKIALFLKAKRPNFFHLQM